MAIRLAMILGTIALAFAVRAVTHSHTAFVSVLVIGAVVRIALRRAGTFG